jgi:hypothetical protein
VIVTEIVTVTETVTEILKGYLIWEDPSDADNFEVYVVAKDMRSACHQWLNDFPGLARRLDGIRGDFGNSTDFQLVIKEVGDGVDNSKRHTRVWVSLSIMMEEL